MPRLTLHLPPGPLGIGLSGRVDGTHVVCVVSARTTPSSPFQVGDVIVSLNGRDLSQEGGSAAGGVKAIVAAWASRFEELAAGEVLRTVVVDRSETQDASAATASPDETLALMEKARSLLRSLKNDAGRSHGYEEFRRIFGTIFTDYLDDRAVSGWNNVQHNLRLLIASVEDVLSQPAAAKPAHAKRPAPTTDNTPAPQFSRAGKYCRRPCVVVGCKNPTRWGTGGACDEHRAVTESCIECKQLGQGRQCALHRRKKPTCSIEGCSRKAYKKTPVPLCERHGEKRSRRSCCVEGCENIAQGPNEDGDEVCIRHGAVQKLCAHPGCHRRCARNGVCYTHGGKVICKVAGCTNGRVRDGLCQRHGSGPQNKACQVPGCNNKSVNNGVCIRHGATVKTCEHDDCSNRAKKKGLCMRHHKQLESVIRTFHGGKDSL